MADFWLFLLRQRSMKRRAEFEVFATNKGSAPPVKPRVLPNVVVWRNPPDDIHVWIATKYEARTLSKAIRNAYFDVGGVVRADAAT